MANLWHTIAALALEESQSRAYLALEIKVICWSVALSICSAPVIRLVISPMSSPFNRSVISNTLNDFIYTYCVYLNPLSLEYGLFKNDVKFQNKIKYRTN